jgi:CHASE1-domain containing sensor protein
LDNTTTKSDTSSFVRRARLPPEVARHAVVVLVVAVGLLATLWGWRTAHNRTVDDEHGRFLNEADTIQLALRERFSAYIAALRGGKAFFGASERVERDEWRAYVETLGLLENYPGIQGMGFSLRIPASEKAAHEAVIRAEGFPSYEIRPFTPREEYHSIVFLEPFTNRNLRAFGYDMFSEAIRRKAMERSRDLEEPALSGRVVLVQETDENPQSGFLLYVPVYHRGAATDTVEERRIALQGFVYSVFRADDLMASVMAGNKSGVAVQIHDGTVPGPDSLMHDGLPKTLGPNYVPKFEESRLLQVAGHEWTLRFCTLPAFANPSRTSPAMLVLAGGLLLTGFLGALLSTVLRRAAEIERLVERRTVELKHANALLELENAERRLAEERRQQTLDSLAAKNAELERFNSLAVGRELRMIELKREINALSRAAGSGDRYELGAEAAVPGKEEASR